MNGAVAVALLYVVHKHNNLATDTTKSRTRHVKREEMIGRPLGDMYVSAPLPETIKAFSLVEHSLCGVIILFFIGCSVCAEKKMDREGTVNRTHWVTLSTRVLLLCTTTIKKYSLFQSYHYW